jgi:GTPase SAR1 family protein
MDKYIPEMTKAYYRNVDSVIYMFDLTNRKSFEKIPKFLSYVQKYFDENNFVNDVNSVLVGNKKDLKNREISEYEGIVCFKI